MPRPKTTFPWVAQREGVYYVFFYDERAGRTKRFSLGTKNSLEAQARFAAFLREGNAFRETGRPNLTVRQALNDYRDEHVKDKVIDQARFDDAMTHLLAFFGDTPLSAIHIPASRDYAAARRAGRIGGGERRKDKRGSDSTIRRELVVLQAAANHALRWKRLEPADMPRLEMPAEPRPEAVSDDEWLTKAELELAIARATGRLRDFIMLAYYTAGRRASIERLTRFQVNLERGQIDLRGPGESVLQRRSVKRRPKVPIAQRLRPVVERLLATTPNEWLFGDTREMYRPFREHMEAIGLDHKAHPHVLRHSRATHLLQDGVSIYDVARLLGDTVATVERVYGHHSPEYLAEAIKESGA